MENSEEKESFENSLKKLEEVINELERGELPLDKALEKYEEGVNRLKKCYAILEQVEKKIVLLVRKEDGTMEEVPFERGKNILKAPPKPKNPSLL